MEGEWKDFYNHQVLNFTPPWGKGEPNGGTNENCGKVFGDKWFDDDCKMKNPCMMCQRQPSLHLRLRGLCAKSAVDKYYHPMNSVPEFKRLQLVGQLVSTIEYDKKNKTWSLTLAGSDVSGP